MTTKEDMDKFPPRLYGRLPKNDYRWLANEIELVGDFEYLSMIEHTALVERLREEKAELRKALEFYADKDNWERIVGHTTWASNLKIQDCAFYNAGGGRARAALKAVGCEEGEL